MSEGTGAGLSGPVREDGGGDVREDGGGDVRGSVRPAVRGSVDAAVTDAATRRTLAWLRARRGADRARRFGYGVYVTVMLVGGWYGLYAVGVLAALREGAPLADHAAPAARTLPSGLPFLALAALYLSVRDALWRGPVIPPRAEADWLLALPVRRGPLLRPWFALSVAAWTMGALLVGFAGAMLLAATGLAGIGALTWVCLVPAACVGLLGVASAVVVEGSDRAAALVHHSAPFVAPALLLLAAQAALAGLGHRQPVLENVVLWSGPWGWAAQPVLAATGRSTPLWQVALVLLAVTTATALTYGVRRVPTLPAATLRVRARAASGVVAGLMAADLRAAGLSAAAVPTAAGRAVTRGARLAARMRPPRSASLVVPWRDAVALVAAPRRAGLAVTLLLPSGALAVLAARTDGPPAFGATLVAAAIGCAAASRLLEPARLDADDTRRTAWSPRPPACVALDHAVLPTLVVASVGVLLSVPVAVRAYPAAPLVPLVTAPVLVASCLLNTYRPPPPAALLFGGAALADFGPFFTVIWNVIGPLAGIIGLALLWTSPVPVLSPVLTCALGAALLWWLRARARAR